MSLEEMSKKALTSSLKTLRIIKSNSINQVPILIESKNSKINLPLIENNGYLSVILIKWMVAQKF